MERGCCSNVESYTPQAMFAPTETVHRYGLDHWAAAEKFFEGLSKTSSAIPRDADICEYMEPPRSERTIQRRRKWLRDNLGPAAAEALMPKQIRRGQVPSWKAPPTTQNHVVGNGDLSLDTPSLMKRFDVHGNDIGWFVVRVNENGVPHIDGILSKLPDEYNPG